MRIQTLYHTAKDKSGTEGKWPDLADLNLESASGRCYGPWLALIMGPAGRQLVSEYCPPA